MARHAMDKTTFKKSGFDTCDYADLGRRDRGIHFARLVLKRWGNCRMFLYLEFDNGKKKFAYLGRKDKYLGFWDIPDGAIVRIRIGRNDMITEAEWLPDERDPKEARKHYPWIRGVIRQYKRTLSRIVASIGFVLPLRHGEKTPKGEIPCNPNKNRKER